MHISITAFASVHFGKFASVVGDEYPRTEDRDPLAEIFEGQPRAEAKDGEVVSLSMPPLRRVFFVDSSGNYLLQLQPSRFLANWRKERERDEYPRFHAAYQRFLRGWRQFREFAVAEKLGAPQVNQYELSYVNHIPEAGARFPAGIEEFVPFSAWSSAQTLKFLPAPRTANVRLQFPLPDSKGTLHVSITHGQRRSDRKGLLVFDLTARGAGRADFSDMDDWFGIAHEWIVRGFTDLTSPGAHRVWERER